MKKIKLEITAQSPLAIGRQKPGGSISEVETYIPGTVIRGAIAGLMIRQHQSASTNFAEDSNSDFKKLFIDGGAIFQNAYPALAETGESFQTHSEVRVLPATALSAKGKSGFLPKGNGVFDSLIDRFYAEQYGQVYDPSFPNKDGGRVDPYKTFYSRHGEHYYPHSTSTRLLTRVGINRRRATAEDEILYSIQVLDEVKAKSNSEPVPMVFCGDIIVEAEESVEKDFSRYLQHNSNNIRLGGSASRGLGKVSIQVQESAEIKPEVSNRLIAFNKAFQKRWQSWRIFDQSQSDPTANRIFFTVGLQSDAILREQWQRSTVISADMLQSFVGNIPGDLKLESAYSSYDYRSGWNSAWGLMKDTELITDRGSVYLFSIETIHQKDWISALENLENRGIGDRTMEGFGQVKICDEFHCVLREHAVMKLEIELKIQKGIRDAEDDIVKAISAALNKKESYGGLEESQFRNLLNVATSTSSSEVVKNFLRYQSGRDKKWGQGTGSLAEAIINDIQQLLFNTAKAIVTNAEVSENVTAKINEVHMDLIRRYLGYGSRHLVYLLKNKSKTK